MTRPTHRPASFPPGTIAMIAWVFLFTLLNLGGAPARASGSLAAAYVVRQSEIADEKSVFATIQSAYTVPARVRTGGTILSLTVRQGDYVAKGAVIAVVGDPKLGLQSTSYAAQIAAAAAQAAQARLEFDRAQRLVAGGGIARNAYDQSRTNLDVAESNLSSIRAQAAVVAEQAREGEVRAPTSGRVIAVPVTAGTVVMAGDAIATVAERDFVLRLEVPERHAQYLKLGGSVRLDGSDVGIAAPSFGTLTLIYPDVDHGHVVADAKVAGLGDYFVGQRVRVWISAGRRPAILVPENLIVTRAGIDYAKISTPDGGLDVPVQRGQQHLSPDAPPMLEILSGLAVGDRLLKP